MARILVADDEPALLEIVSEIVERLGHECLRAIDGAEALALAHQKSPDLVVTDLMMPGKTGVELARALKVHDRLAHIPVVLLSAGRPSANDQEAVWLFLPKPPSLERLEQALVEGLALSKARAEAVGIPAHAPPVTPDCVSPTNLQREEMLSWVSHEIRSPLSAAVTATQLAVRELHAQPPDVVQVERRLTVISRQHARILELIDSLLDAAALQDGRLDLAMEPFDVAGLVDDAARAWQETHADVLFDVVLPDGGLEVRGNRERLRQVLDNLLSNAVKYGRPENVVHVSAAQSEDQVCISVRDEGAGIPLDQLDRIFGRFHRVPGKSGQGHGLGLYIARALARLHGGDIEVRSEPGRGATFTVVLPRHQTTDASAGLSPTAASPR